MYAEHCGFMKTGAVATDVACLKVSATVFRLMDPIGNRKQQNCNHHNCPREAVNYWQNKL